MTKDGWISADGVSGLVSIVVPTHNRAQLLRETLDSLIKQSYRPQQLVVVDDGSTDNTEEVVRAVAKTTDCEIIYQRQEQAGGPAARNTGARLTTGEFLVFMDDDDLAPEQFVALRVKAIKTKQDATMACGLWHVFDVVENEYRTLSIRGQVAPDKPFDWYSFACNKWELLLQGCVIRRELVSQTGPWTVRLRKSQDLEYKARLLSQSNCRPVFVEQAPVYYRLHNDSISGAMTDEKLASYVEVVNQLEAMAVKREDYEQNKDRVADILWHHSFWLYSIGEFAAAKRFLMQAKKHASNVCRRKGTFASMLDACGLVSWIGPAYYTISQGKKSLGFSRRPVITKSNKLPV